jgi:tRNA C32,U32 (ribose-2'-O)-methylase TrmJ
MFGQLCDLLEPRGYFQPESRAASTRRTLRTMLTKPAWNHLEIRTLRGVLSTLRRTPVKNPRKTELPHLTQRALPVLGAPSQLAPHVR